MLHFFWVANSPWVWERNAKVCSKRKNLAVVYGVLLQLLGSNILLCLVLLNYMTTTSCTFLKYYKTWYPFCCKKNIGHWMLVSSWNTIRMLWDCIFQLIFLNEIHVMHSKISLQCELKHGKWRWLETHFKSTFLLQMKMLMCTHISNFPSYSES